MELGLGSWDWGVGGRLEREGGQSAAKEFRCGGAWVEVIGVKSERSGI